LFDLFDCSFLLPFGFGKDEDVVIEALVMDIPVPVEHLIQFQEIKFGQNRGKRATEGNAALVCLPHSGDEDYWGNDLFNKTQNNGVFDISFQLFHKDAVINGGEVGFNIGFIDVFIILTDVTK